MRSGPGHQTVRALWARRVLRTVIYLGIAYVALVTADVNAGRVPMKIFVTGLVLAAWLVDYRPWQRGQRYPSAVPVLLAGVLVPLFSFAVAWWLHRHHDPAQHSGLTYSIQQGSRFCYLLLYFPIAAEIRRVSGAIAKWDWVKVHSVWFWAGMAVCVLTIGLYLAYEVGGVDFGHSGQLGPFKGSLGVGPDGTFRAFLPTDIMIIPAGALALGMIAAEGVKTRSAVLMAIILAATVLAHTRGIWLGIAAAGAIVVVGMWTEGRGRAIVRGTALLVTLGFLAALAVSTAPSVARSASNAVISKHEDSTNKRFDQEPQLYHGYRRHPITGSGLGATLPSGFERNAASPWAFELTYLELLFQLGPIGLAIVLGGPLWMLARLCRRLAHAAALSRLRISTAAASIAGLLLASASNPYLMTSVGMLGLAIAFAMGDDGLAAPLEKHELGARRPFGDAGDEHREDPEETEVLAF